MANVDRDELHQWIEAIRDDIREGFRGTHERQDHTNGRLRKAETDIAILNDRAEQAAKAAADAAAKASGAASRAAGSGAVVVGLFEFVKWIYGVLAS